MAHDDTLPFIAPRSMRLRTWSAPAFNYVARLPAAGAVATRLLVLRMQPGHASESPQEEAAMKRARAHSLAACTIMTCMIAPPERRELPHGGGYWRRNCVHECHKAHWQVVQLPNGSWGPPVSGPVHV